MRIGLAGVGRIGAFHATTLRGLKDVRSLVIADLDRNRRDEISAAVGAEAVESPERLLSAGIDALVIATPTRAHADLLIDAVQNGIPVFCEKPVAVDVPGTVGVLDKVADVDVPVQVGFQRRFDDGFAAARAAVTAGQLGWLHTIRAGTLDPAPPPRTYVATSGGLLRDCAVHDFDAIRWVTGAEVAEVYAVGGNRGARFFAAVGDVSTASVLLTLADGTFAHVAATRYNAAGYDVRLELLGSADSLSVGLDDRSPLRPAEPGARCPAGQPHRHFLNRFAAAYERELAAFVDVVAGRAEVGCSVRDALEAFYVAEAGERSLRERRPVLVDEVRK